MSTTATAVDRNTIVESEDKPTVRHSAWKPRWSVDLGDGDTLGIAIDDGCFVVLYLHADGWRPGTHIPKEAAKRIAELCESGALGY